MIKKIIVAILLLVCNTISAFAFDKWDYLNDVKATSWNPLSAYNSIYLGASYQNIVKAFPSSQWEIRDSVQLADGHFKIRFQRHYDIKLPNGKYIPASQYINIVGDNTGVNTFSIDFNVFFYENMVEDTYLSFLKTTEKQFGSVQKEYNKYGVTDRWIRPNNTVITIGKSKIKYGDDYQYRASKTIWKT